MATLTSLPPSHKPSPYTGKIEVDFKQNKTNGQLEASIKTEHLELRPTAMKDLKTYRTIFCNKKNMALYYGGALTQDQTTERVKEYVNKWQGLKEYAGKPCPYSGFSIIYQNEVVGHIALGEGNEKGEAEIGYAIHRKYHHLGIAKEATAALVHGFVPKLLENGYVNLEQSDSTDSGPLEYIKATALPKNTYSWYVLEDAGFTRHGYDQTTGMFDYRISITQILSTKV